MEEYNPRDIIVRKARVNPSHIGYINSIVESYEGIGQVRTLDSRLGIIIFWIMPDRHKVFEALIDEFEKDLSLIMLSEEDPV